MTAQRDTSFPATSIGRTQGAHIARTPSRESLSVHPLLNPAQSAALDSAKYVPYTPRQQRLATSQTSSRPQLANLKAAAQTIGLEPNSLGWAILEKIAYEGDTSDEWSEIWNALTKARATLLLPAEPSLTDLITLELVQDHLIWCDLAARDNTAVVTLSGLRGQLVSDTLTFRSSLHRSTKPYQSLVTPAVSRTVALDALPPLPVFPLESSYPSFVVSAFSAELPLPCRATKPPLPPRLGARGAPTPSARLSMPFVAFFGQRPSTPPPGTTIAAHTDVDATIDVSALVIDTTVSRADIATTVLGALKGEIAAALADQPPWLVERVHTFSLPYLPFVRMPVVKKKLQDIGGNPNRVVYVVNGTLEKPEELADKFQGFYMAMEAELREGDHRVREDGVNGEPVEGEDDEARIRNVIEMIESTLCTLLYDRLFLPSSSDDASHNEALSSRIAALNMLDLGLEHLDIDIGDANQAAVDAVVKQCGQALAELDAAARSPHEKAAVLISANQLVVEGLSSIPPIRLKSRDQADKDPTLVAVDSAEDAVSALPAALPISSPEEKPSPVLSMIHLSISPDHSSALKQPPSDTAPSTSSPISGDVLLPILIFSVVKANPLRLVSHLLFTQRFRNQSIGGQESYCLINLMAVAEFLENVDLGALGLGESENKVISAADLTPIPIARTEPVPEQLHGRVERVDAIAAANKVISGVVDTSFGVLRAFLPTASTAGAVPATAATMGTDAQWRPGLGLLRREAGFSIAGLTAAVAGKPKGHTKEEGQRELVEVGSRPPSLPYRADDAGSSGESAPGSGEEDDEDDEGEPEGQEGQDKGEEEEAPDTRSIKSFESMLSSRRKKEGPSRRKRLTDLTDRLTHGISRRVQGDTLHKAAGWQLPPPNRRFIECTEQDIRVAEVGELLREYQRLVEAVRSAGGFQE